MRYKCCNYHVDIKEGKTYFTAFFLNSIANFAILTNDSSKVAEDMLKEFADIIETKEVEKR